MWSRLYQHKQVPLKIPLNAPTTITREIYSGHFGFISTVKYTLTRLNLVVVTALNQPRTNFGSVHVLWWYNYNEKASLAVVCRLTKKDINNGFCLLVICPADLLLLVIHLITISTLGLTIGCASFENFSSSSYRLFKLQQMQISILIY